MLVSNKSETKDNVDHGHYHEGNAISSFVSLYVTAS